MQPLKIDKPIRLIELFAGIGSQAKALKLLNANFEHYRICEFDKYAIKSYNAIHGTNFETSDITKITADDLGIVDTDKYCYIMTYSFPCQDLSLAGKQKGMAKGENTRSGLLWEVERLLNECSELPQILLMENVTQVHGKKNIEHFNEWIAFLESKGYRNYWKDLNAKNFCIPQNRNRTFMVSVLGDYTYEFPQEFPLNKRLKDLLEKEVDEKFYLSDKMKNYILDTNNVQKGTKWEGRADGDVINPNVAHTISVCGAGGNQRAGVSNFIIDGEEEIKVKELKEKINQSVENCYVSEKGVKYILDSKRGMATDVNADVCQPLTAKGQANWTGSFISPNIESIEKSSTIGGTKPTKINLKNGQTIYFDGENFCEEEPKVIGGIGEKKSNGGRQWYLQDRIYDNNIATSVTTAFNPFYKVEEPQERFFKQALETLAENDCSAGDTVDAYNKKVNSSGISPTITTRPEGFKTAILPVVEPLAYDEQNGYIRKDGTVGTLTTDGSSPKHNNRVIEPVRLGYIPYPNSDKPHQSNTFYDENAISPTLDTCTGGNRQVKVLKDDLRIRKLTPKECWRLMGFTDEDFEKAAQLNSNAQLYKQAGNSIVVSVLYYIFKGML